MPEENKTPISDEAFDKNAAAWAELAAAAEQWSKETVETLRTALGVKADPPPDEPDKDPDAEGEPQPDPEAEVETLETASVDVPTGIRRLILNLQQEIAKAFGQKSLADGKFSGIYSEDDIFEPGFKASGNYWYARWSNSFQDRDGEWFAEKAHEAFVERVKSGVSEMPELWVEHIPGTRIGQAKVVGGIGHFMIAAGTFDDTPLGRAAKAYYAKHAVKGVSHGFYFDPAHYVDKVFGYYDTFEISPLRRKTPSNAWTTFDKVREMKLTDKDLSILNEMFGEDVVKTEIIAKTEEASKALEAANKRFKTYLEVETTTEVAKTAASKAETTFGEMVLGLMESHAVAMQGFDAASKKMDERDAALKADNAALREEVAGLKALLEQRPRASQSDSTLLDAKDGKGKELLEEVHKQMVERDGFWGTDVIKAP